MKPDLIVRKNNKFVVDEAKLLPYMRGSKDLVISAVSLACTDLKMNPNNYSSDPIQKLKQLNDTVYQLLEKWGVYKR